MYFQTLVSLDSLPVLRKTPTTRLCHRASFLRFMCSLGKKKNVVLLIILCIQIKYYRKIKVIWKENINQFVLLSLLPILNPWHVLPQGYSQEFWFKTPDLKIPRGFFSPVSVPLFLSLTLMLQYPGATKSVIFFGNRLWCY